MIQSENDEVFKSSPKDLEFSHVLVVEMSKIIMVIANDIDNSIQYRYPNRYTTPIPFYNYTIYSNI